MKKQQEKKETTSNANPQAKLGKLSIKEMLNLKGGGRRSKPGSWT